MRNAKVLKPFKYAHDGINVRDLNKGDTFECQDDVFDGLVRDKYIKESDAPAADQGAAQQAAEQQTAEQQTAQQPSGQAATA